uniref:CRIB domain-containing protein n=1 Tax=Wuchereria bancrofti TaxID=6293 RepID=A0AAF5PFT8_WUCBA
MEEQFIVLDIGGRLFKTKVTTLISIDGSYFQQLFNKKWDHLLDSNGHLFIDRNNDVFPAILGYLRHGKSYPLPADDYKLSLIIYEAQFYKLPELIEAAESVRCCMKRNFIPSKPLVSSSNSSGEQYSIQKFKNTSLAKEMATKPLLSIPMPPPLPQKFTGDDETLLKQFLRKLSKKYNKDKIEIGPPNEFKHIVHIGQTDDGRKIIIDHSSNDQKTIKTIVQAIYDEISALPVVYSLIDADENANCSESVEIFFTESTIQAYHSDMPLSSQKLSTSLRTGFYDNCCYEIARSDKTKKFRIKGIKSSPIVTDI